MNMTAEEIASKIITTERYDTSETPIKEGAKLIIAFAESLAKDRAVGFAEYIDKKYQLMIDGSIEENYDTFLAEQRKEGAEKSFCECGSQKDSDCKYCTSCNKFHSV